MLPVMNTSKPTPSKVVSADELSTGNWPTGRVVLSIVGVILLGLFIAGFVSEQTAGRKTSTTTKTTSTVAVTKSATMTKTVTTKPKVVSSVIDPQAEGLLLALLGFGAATLLASAMYARISAIKLPGGVEIDLTPEERAAVTHQLASHIKSDAKREAVIEATAVALDLARVRKSVSGEPLTETAIKEVVVKGIASVT
jgi:hypothetical protein